MKPGQTQSPDASTSRPPRPPTAPTALIRPARTATSATRRGAPLPSITVPPRITRSIIPMSPRRDEYRPARTPVYHAETRRRAVDSRARACYACGGSRPAGPAEVPPMTGFADYESYDALGLADLVRRRLVTPTELLDAAIARVEARNPVVNAVVLRLYDHARKAIADGLPDGPFRGLPYLLKDLTATLAGVPTTRGSKYFADTPPPTVDSEHVRRLKRAGLAIFGRTNTPELGLSLTCEPQLYGPTRNPWDPARVAGGSR